MLSIVGLLAWRAAAVRSSLAGNCLVLTPSRPNDLVVAAMLRSM
jgi:hypothetical protein